ncbi:MAG: hypothetical protein GVY14_02315 [Spirochaetes bacterium]|nr:hypothetical protein [Spirochaetota bacterium]
MGYTRKYMYRPFAALLMLFLVTTFLQAQEEAPGVDSPETASPRAEEAPVPRDGRIPIGMVLTAEGRRLSFFREGSVSAYDAYLEPVAGRPVLAGSLLQLEENTSLELQLLPARTRMKLGAQATIRLEAVDDAGGGRLTMYFGRLRAIVPSSAASDVVVEGPDARVTIAPGSDVAVDVLADPANAAVYTAVSTIAGSATVQPKPIDAESEVTVVAGGTRARTVPAEAGVALEVSDALEGETVAFWARHSFEARPAGPVALEDRFPQAYSYVYGFYGEPPQLAEPLPETQPEPAPEDGPPEAEIEPLPTLPELDLAPPEFAERDRTELRNGGLGLMVMGAVFAGAGYGVDYAADAFLSDAVQPEGVSPGTVMMYAGGGFFVTGLITFLVSQF